MTVLLKYVSTSSSSSSFFFFFCQLSHFISFPDVHKVGREIVATSRLTHRLLILRTLRTVSDIVTKITWILESLNIFHWIFTFFSLVWNSRYMDPPGYWISFPDSSYYTSSLVFSCQQKSTSKVSDAFDCSGRPIFWNICYVFLLFHITFR